MSFFSQFKDDSEDEMQKSVEQQPMMQKSIPEMQEHETQVQEQPKSDSFFGDFSEPQDILVEAKTGEQSKKKPKKGKGRSFVEGLTQESTSGQLAKFWDNRVKDPTEYEDPTFWEDVAMNAGTLIGDAPFLAIGGYLGQAVGGILGGVAGAAGGPVGVGIGARTGSTVGAGAGAMGFNGFLKESLKQYHEFQESGGDLTYGEFLERAATVGNSTLREGSMGAILSSVNKVVPVLKNTPIGGLFNAKYVAPTAPISQKGAQKVIEKGVELGSEVAAATVVPAASEGRLPTSRDVATATVLFAAPKVASGTGPAIKYTVSELPPQISNFLSFDKWKPMNTALAEKIEQQNLPYPALPELQGDHAALKKNSIDLSNNIIAFDSAYIKQFTDRIENISDKDFPSSRAAGMEMRKILIGNTPETQIVSPISERPVDQPVKPTKKTISEQPEIPKPVRPNRPLAQSDNPLRQGVNTIANERFSSDVEAGRQIQNEYHRIRDEAYAPFNERYENISQAASGIEGIFENLAGQTLEFINEHSQSAAPNSPEQVVIRKAEQLLNTLGTVNDEGQVGGYNEVSVRQLIETNKSLKKAAFSNLPGNFKGVLYELIENVDRAIEQRLRSENPGLADTLRETNNDYRMFKNRFDTPATRIMFDPSFKEQAIYKKFSGIDGFNQLSEALSQDPQGQQVLNRLRRDVWEQALGDGPLNAATENAFVDSLSRMNEREFSNLMEYLTPEQRSVMEGRVRDVNRMRSAVNEYEQQYMQAQQNYQEAVEQQKRHQKNQKKQNAQQYQKEMAEYKAEVERLKKEEQRKKQDYERAKHNSKNNQLKDLRDDVTDKQDLMVALTEQDPAKLMNNMGTEEGIIRMKRLTKDIQGGPELFKAAARFQTEQMFSFVKDSIIESGRVPYDKIQKQMTNKDFRAKLTALNGPEFVKSMDELVNISSQLSKEYKTKQIQFINDPGVFQQFLNATTAIGLAHGELSVPLLLQVGKNISADRIGSWWRRGKFDQEGITKAVNAARAIKNGDKKAIVKTSKELK